MQAVSNQDSVIPRNEVALACDGPGLLRVNRYSVDIGYCAFCRTAPVRNDPSKMANLYIFFDNNFFYKRDVCHQGPIKMEITYIMLLDKG